MNTLKISIKDRLAIVTLNRPKANAINKEMMDEINELFKNLSQDENIGGVIITGHEGIFSAGLDLIELYNYNEQEVADFWKQFLQFTANLVAFQKPMIAAINGHSPAGGCVIALACDYRVMANGKYKIGLNEVPVGIIVPESIFSLYAFWIGEAQASRSLLAGKLFEPEQALAIGLVDELVNPESILTNAERSMRKMMAFEENTWQQSKINTRKKLMQSLSADQSETLALMLKQWWAPQTRENLKLIIESLKPKNNV
ncbi:MAG: enoyl-CoA hydratase/isomerase family protein [Sphingobacteriaceae bacterium]|nr:enoyl-CoA hydratase/isomerase family protein [Sphingobacteriaceae bacterium]